MYFNEGCFFDNFHKKSWIYEKNVKIIHHIKY
jgi:hypothetical protein